MHFIANLGRVAYKRLKEIEATCMRTLRGALKIPKFVRNKELTNRIKFSSMKKPASILTWPG